MTTHRSCKLGLADKAMNVVVKRDDESSARLHGGDKAVGDEGSAGYSDSSGSSLE